MKKELIMRRLASRYLLMLAFATLTATNALAVWPIPPYTVWPCDPNAGAGQPNACSVADPNDCFSYRSYRPAEALQIRTGDGKSPRSTTRPTSPYGICSGFFDWCKLPPQIGSATAEVVMNPDGGRDIVFNVAYDFPNNYCQVYDDGPPCRASVFPPIHILSIPVVQLLLVDGTEIMHRTPAVFEAGTWKPRLNAGCGAINKTYRIVAANGGGAGIPSCPHPPVEVLVTVNEPAAEPGQCKADRWCPECPDNQPGGSAGEPISLGSGDVSVSQPLFTIDQEPMPMQFGLTYHSSRAVYPTLIDAPMGSGWSHTYSDTLRRVDAAGMFLYRVDGEGHETHYEGPPAGPWAATSPAELRGRHVVTLVAGQYQVRDLDGRVTAFSATTGRWQATTDRWGNVIRGIYDANGVMTTIRDSMGRDITIDHGAGTINSISLPTGETWRFEYDGVSLAKIFDPMHTGTTPWRTYEYVPDSKGVPRLLSAARDESGALLEGHDYDTQGRGTTSYSEGGANHVAVTYLSEGKTRVTTTIEGSQKQISEYTLRYKGGRWIPTQIVGSCASCGASSDKQTFVLDNSNRVTSRTDGSGHVTKFTYDGRGNVTSRVEAFGTPKQRTTAFAYEYASWPSFLTRTTVPSAAKPGAVKVTTFGWNTGETVLTQRESGYLSSMDAAPATYVSTTTFDARHRRVAADGPRTDVADVTSTVYYPDDDADAERRGRARSTTNAAGHTIAFDEYDVYGMPRRVINPNGVITTSETDARGRTTSVTIEAVPGDANESTAYTSTMSFDGRDRAVGATRPRGNGTRVGFDDGRRPTDTVVVDSGGNEIERQHLTLNAVGNKITEEDQVCPSPAPVCPSWISRRSTSYGYDAHNRLGEIRHAAPAGARTVYSYDADGLLVTEQDENHTSPNTRYAYDALDRLITVTQTLLSASGGVAVTRYEYDVMDNLVSVTDPNGNVTRFTYDDFSRTTRQESPVTGVTTYAYDPAGNLTASTDARGATLTRSYDALHRPTTSTAVLAGVTESVTFSYDDATAGHYGIGYLSSMTDPSGQTTYTYDRRGLLRSETKTILGDTYTTSYHHDANGNRDGLVYPSGRELTYGFDAADRPRSLRGVRSGVTTQYIASATYEPGGPQNLLAYGGAMERRATYDARYRLQSLTVAAAGTPLADYRYGRDAVGNITAIADLLDGGYSRSFVYDDLYRLVRADSGAALWGSASYSYDAMGNRLGHSIGARSGAFAYEGSTPRLSSVTETGRTRNVLHDAAGNEVQTGSASFDYSPRSHLAAGDGLRYIYDGQGLRVAQVGLAVGPIVTEQPQSQPVCPGGTVTLRVRASGASSHQWESSSDGTSWSAIGGATSSSVTLTPASRTHYRAVVSNAAASTTSDVATVTPTALAMEPSSGRIYGDLTGDGNVNAADVALLRTVLAGKQALPVTVAVADLNGDGAVDALDLALTSAFAANAIACLPQYPTALAASRAVSILGVFEPEPLQSAPNPTQYFFYSPERRLLSLTELKAAGGMPEVAVDYIWFGGEPVAQEKLATSETRLTFTDHLGTPFLQTTTGASPTWRAEYEPFGDVWMMRAGSEEEQRLRFPGQEFDEQTPERAYNIFRWYRSGWGRYTQVDPLGWDSPWARTAQRTFLPDVFRGFDAGAAYVYALQSPANVIDPTGEAAFAAALPLAGGCALADGPFPIGDAIALTILAGAAIYDLTQPKEATCWKCEPKKKQRWTCNAQCNTEIFKPQPGITYPPRLTGTGYGHSEDAACTAAKAAATGSAPPGSYGRHCKCTACWKN
jgi:RHS repeat-associated protein